MARKVVFLDRDGTINFDAGYVHRLEDFVMLDGAPEGIRLLRDSGFLVAIVTNQSVVGAGKCSKHDVDAIHAHLRRTLREFQTDFDAIAYCPHVPEFGCDCRKPQVGLARLIEGELGEAIDYAASWMVGDKLTDVEFGANLGMNTALIRSRYWSSSSAISPTLVVDSLQDAAHKIVGGLR